MKIIYSPKCLEYKSEGHPESPERVKNSWQYLKEKGYKFIEPKPAQEKDVLLVHSQNLISTVKSGNFLDPDTPNLPGIFNYALLAVGAAITAAGIAMDGDKAFSLMRPPGHHAGRHTLGGFCYFNNIAVAVRKILPNINKAAIVDIDCHHGQGTEEIFFGSHQVLYLSLHQMGTYPNTGLESKKNCYNFPLPANTNPEEYLDALKTGLEKVKEFQPNLIAISAGFDAYKDDPLTGMSLELDTFEEIGRMINQFNIPVFAVLEGGYSQDLPQCIFRFLQGLEKDINR